MLLFLLSDNFRDLPEQPLRGYRSNIEGRAEAGALCVAGLALSVWCVLRLVAAWSHRFDFDVGLAVACLAFGLAATRNGARDFGSARRPARSEERIVSKRS